MFHDKMSTTMDINFGDWLSDQMNKKNWTQADLARASGLNRQVISNYINFRRTNPDPEALISIAKGLNISPITVFRKAGLLPEGGENATFDDWQFLLTQLSSEEQDEIRQIIEMKINRRKKDNSPKSLKPRKAG